ncbi:MAG: hypothetical protein VX624_01620, partial [Pseudomonadota bacterium]|nr:hypothetical protein [Pseudomonadota bacterium]
LDLERDITLDALIGDLVAILDHAEAGCILYCGESMGGILGIALAARHPMRVKSLALFFDAGLYRTTDEGTIRPWPRIAYRSDAGDGH